jgi:hypothetical protein
MVAPFIRGVGRIAASGFDFPIPPFLRRPARGGFPSGVVEPPVLLPGVRRALPMEDPQDVNFVMPSRAVPEAPPIQVLPPQLMESLVRGRSPRLSSTEISFEPRTVASERYTDILNPIVPGRSPAQVRYMPLPAVEVSRITRYAEEDPLAAIIEAVHAVEDSVDPEQFAVALQAVRAVRRGAPEADIFSPMQRTLDNAINRRAVELGIPQDVIDELPKISNAARPRGLYKESQELAQKGFNSQEQNAWPFIQSLRKQKKNLAKSNPSESDLDVVGSMLFGPAGGQIMRMVRSGDIGLDHARRLHDDAAELYLDMLRADLGTVIRGKGLRAIQGDKIAKMSDEGKTRMYAFAMQSADSPDEVSAISAIWRTDVKNPNFIDELDMLEGHAVERLNSFARVDPWTAQPRARATIDEESITQANVAQRDFDAARFEGQRPENQGPIVKKVIRNPETKKMEEVATGTIASRRYKIGDVGQGEGYSMGNPVSPEAWEASTLAPASERIFRRSSKSNVANEPLSALRMKLNDGRTIEEAYQLDVKGYREAAMSSPQWRNQPWKRWMEGKGKPTLNGQTLEQLKTEYKNLWQSWFNENPDQLNLAGKAIGNKPINDVYARPGAVSQSEAIHEILVERGLRYAGDTST